MDLVPSTSKSPYKFKVVLLGEGAVGKTSLLMRYAQSTFNPRHISTVQASFLCKKDEINGKQVEFNIWDTAGQERFHALGPIYYRDSNGALLIYDITDLRSFEKVKLWVKELRQMLGTNVVLTIVGNKVDLFRLRNVEPEIANDFAKSVGAEYFETSAKDNTGITQLFNYLMQALIDRADMERCNESNSKSTTDAKRGAGILIIDDPPPPSKRCCSQQ